MALTPEEQRELELLELQYLESLAAQPAPKQEKRGASLQQEIAEGAVVPWAEAYYGIKDLIRQSPVGTMLPGGGTLRVSPTTAEEDAAKLKGIRERGLDTPLGQVGRFGSEAAQFAIPGGAGVRVANKVGGRVLPMAIRGASDVAGSAAVGAIRAPQEGETRGERAGTEAAWAAAGNAAPLPFKALRNTYRVMKNGPDLTNRPLLRSAIEKGYKPIPGEIYRPAARFENLMRRWPAISKGMRRLDMESDQSFNRWALQEAAPPDPLDVQRYVQGAADQTNQFKVVDIGHKGVAQLDDAYQRAWSAAHVPLYRVDQDALLNSLVQFEDSIKLLDADEAARAANLGRKIWKWIADNPDKSTKEIDMKIKELQYKEGISGDLFDSLDELRSGIKSGMPQRNREMVDLIDSQYGNYAAVNNAAQTKGAMQRQVIDEAAPDDPQIWGAGRDAPVSGVFTPDELATGAGQATLNRRAAGRGEAPMQDVISTVEGIRNEAQSVLPTMSVRMREAFPDPKGLTYRIGRRLAGTAPGQVPYRAMTPEEMERILLRRTLLSPGRAAAAYEE